MNKASRFLSFVTAGLLLLASLGLSSCKKADFSIKGDFYYCSKNHVSYKAVSFEYSPVAIKTRQAFGRVKDEKIEKSFYEIQYVSADRWISTEAGDLFCAEGENVPTLTEMEANYVLICREGASAVISIADIRNPNVIRAIVNDYETGTGITYPLGNEVAENLKLRLASEKYPWLYYNLSYVEFASDIYEYDYPKDLDTYTYRTVSSDVTVSTSSEFECCYAVADTAEENRYVQIAKDAGIRYYTVKKAVGDGTYVNYVVFVFPNEKSVSSCVSYVLSTYKGALSEEDLQKALETPAQSESINVVSYNYGKYFVYNRFNGKCVKADPRIHDYKENSIVDEAS